MIVVLALGTGTAGALGGPPQRLASLQARVDKLATEHSQAAARLEAIEFDVATQSEKLDALLEREETLQKQLNSRALGMYRGRRLDFIDVLTNSASFAEFSSRLDLLTRMNIADARGLVELEATKAKAARAGRTLLERQQEAAAELRRLQAAKLAATRQLSGSKAAYAAYVARVQADERKRPALARPVTPRIGTTARPAGAGGWKTGVASHYGKGSYGRHTADGTTIGPDSMIVAHKTLPFGTLVQFQYQGRTCVARVADRGPYTPGRMWDLGPGVIRILGFNGVDTVRYRIVGR